MNYVREYWSKIESGEIVTSRRVKAVYGRLMREMDEPAEGSRYYFDEETGERPIIFIERFCKQSQGTLGAPLGLELFQKAFIQKKARRRRQTLRPRRKAVRRRTTITRRTTAERRARNEYQRRARVPRLARLLPRPP